MQDYDQSTPCEAVRDAPVSLASPADACSPLSGFSSGHVCVVWRGGCTFLLKAKHCSEAGARGVVVVNGVGQAMTVMNGDHTEIQQYGLIIPVMLVSNADGIRLQSTEARLTFPVISRSVVPQANAPYSRFGPVTGGRSKPDVVLPGDGILVRNHIISGVLNVNFYFCLTLRLFLLGFPSNLFEAMDLASLCLCMSYKFLLAKSRQLGLGWFRKFFFLRY